MHLNPTSFDVWITVKLAEQVARHPHFDDLVSEALRHNLLGGFWYSLALFVFWLEGTRPGREKTSCRILAGLAGTGFAIAFALIAARAVSWPPPANYPALARYYAAYFAPNPNANCFPSMSTALYLSVAVGIFAENRVVGSVLALLVPLIISLPRMYVGGHYPTDILVGASLGLAGPLIAFRFVEPRLSPLVPRAFASRWQRVFLETLVFVWILEIAVEFSDLVWLTHLVSR